jgi:hypothetical protein
LPVGITYVPGSLQITAGSNIGTKTDALADDQGEYDAATRTITVRLGNGANGTVGGTVPPGGSSTIKFRVKIDPNAPAKTRARSGSVVVKETNVVANEISDRNG